MTGFIELVAIAAIAQLTVLPGEKGQFIIAGLATRYRPLLVVGAASTAFGAWTVLEILLGHTLQGLFPAVFLDLLTAGLFLFFAVVLFTSAPDRQPLETDGGSQVLPEINETFELFGHSIGGPVGQFLSVFTLMSAGEFGDKTQLITIGLAAQYGATPAIWIGEMLAIVPISLANAYLFHRFSHRFDLHTAHYVGAVLFAFFGGDTLLSVFTGISLWEQAVGAVSTILLSAL